MNEEFVIPILILGSTVLAFIASLAEQWRHHQSSNLFSLFRRTLNWEGFELKFAVVFLPGFGAVVGGGYLAGVLSSLLDLKEDSEFLARFVGAVIGLLVMQFWIVPKMVIPQSRPASRDQEEPSSSPPEL